MDPNNSANDQPPGGSDGSPSSAKRAVKRQRHCSFSGNDKVDDYDTTTAKQLALPPEVWADVMRFLPFDTILTCGAVSRSMLHETMPLLTKLRIDKATQMNLTVASRFRDVTDIHINSLLTEQLFDVGTEDEIKDIDVDLETKNRVVPFLSRFVQTLERVHFGGTNATNGEVVAGFAAADGYFIEDGDLYPNEGSWGVMKGFIDQISAAFDVGAFPKRLQISGLACPNILNRMGHDCSTCQRACNSFPLESVVEFESKGSSVSNARSGRKHGLDVCLPIAEVESIIENRPGGKELLLSDSRLLRLLGSGRRWQVKSNDSDRALLIVKFTETQLDEIKRVIQYAKLDVKKLSAPNLQKAILNSFGSGNSIPSKCQCYLSESSLTYLKDEVGLCIDCSVFDCNVSGLLEYVKPIVGILVQFFNENEPPSYDNIVILSDCLRLIRQFLELEKNAPNQHIATAIPTLARLLMSTPSYDYEVKLQDKMEAAKSLNIFLTKGNKLHWRMVVNASVVSKFSRLLDGCNGDKSIINIALTGLVNIIDKERHHVDTVVNEGGIPKLITILDSSDNVCKNCSLRLLVIASSNHIQMLLDRGIVPCLFRMALSPDGQLDCVPIFSTLLRKVIESDTFPIQQAIDAIFIKRLTKMLTTSEDETVLTNLAFVCITIASAANEDNIDTLMKDTGLLQLLVDLQDSPLDAVSEQALTCLEHIAAIRSAFDAESKGPLALAWGEYRVLELVDSDEDSLDSFEEALEVSDEQVALEEQQALDANAPIYIYNHQNANTDDDDQNETPTLLGIPRNVLQTILIYATETQTEINVLETVCKKFAATVSSDDADGFPNGFYRSHPNILPTLIGVRVNPNISPKKIRGLRMIRKFQKSSCNEIMNVICETNINVGGSIADTDKLRAFAVNLLAKMHHLGPAASFRMREDAINALFELCQAYITKRLENALLLAIHSHRTEVQMQDFILLPSQEIQARCNVGGKYHQSEGFSFVCSCSLPSSSGIVWRWPENDCRDVLPPDAGRRIIRRLAYRAGIFQMTSNAFELVEAELLHTLGVLLVEAYESCVEMSKNARFLDQNEEEILTYNLSPDSMDVFYVPPPPISAIEYVKESDSYHSTYVHTIVPGQICTAAKLRNIPAHKIYGGWIAGSEEEMDFELSLYFRDSSDCDEHPNNDGCDDVESANKSDGNHDATCSGGDLGRPVVAPPAPVAHAAAAAPANASQPAPARDALEALRAHPRFEELQRRFQNNFSSARTLLNEIIQQHPVLRVAIDTNQAAFYAMMSQ